MKKDETFSRLIEDPTARRLLREHLEEQEGTPRAEALSKLRACEFAVTRLLEGGLMGCGATQLEDLAGEAYDLLNDAYLAISPEAETVEPLMPA